MNAKSWAVTAQLCICAAHDQQCPQPTYTLFAAKYIFKWTRDIFTQQMSITFRIPSTCNRINLLRSPLNCENFQLKLLVGIIGVRRWCALVCSDFHSQSALSTISSCHLTRTLCSEFLFLCAAFRSEWEPTDWNEECTSRGTSARIPIHSRLPASPLIYFRCFCLSGDPLPVIYAAHSAMMATSVIPRHISVACHLRASRPFTHITYMVNGDWCTSDRTGRLNTENILFALFMWSVNEFMVAEKCV